MRHLAGVVALLAIVALTGTPARAETDVAVLDTPNGGIPRILEIHGYPLFNGDGQLSHVVKYVMDITERKKAECALEEKKAQLDTVINSLPFLVFGIDSTGRYFLQNAFLEEFWGSIIGKRPEDCAPDLKTLASRLPGRKSCSRSYCARRRVRHRLLRPL